MPLQEPVTILPRVGPIRAEKLVEAGLRTVEDILRQFPRAYETRARCLVANARADQLAIVEVTVIRAMFLGFGGRKRLEVATQDTSSALKLVFFNPQRINVKAQFQANQSLIAVGKIERFNGVTQMVHPKLFKLDNADSLEGIFPVYPQIKGITSAELGGHVRSALALLNKTSLKDPFDSDWLLAHNMAPIANAYHWIHESTDLGSPKRAKSLRRFAFEEVFSVQLSMQKRQLENTHKSGIVLKSAAPETLFSTLLPFSPTQAQARSLSEIMADMESGQPMSRLLQGDVGSGKTAVCATACLVALQNHVQCAVLAPTDILVEQHLTNFRNWFAPLGYRVEKLTGGQKESEKRLVLQGLANGEIHIVIGTHALLTESVIFKNLKLSIIDEQHRFGVAQRRILREKGETLAQTPHLLVMTATPIPRSLALTLYGDMTLSVIDQLPPGRTPIETKIIMGNGLSIATKLSAKLIRDNEQAYLIFPLVEESEKIDLQNAVQAYELLCAEFGAEHFALAHGKMKQDAKENAMRRFASGDAQILISTTVVEVGVDVPNASHMVIMNAERFGLSQLHQLRGRVGRGKKKSFCYLVIEKESTENAQRRLAIMARTNDGFEIASEDLAIRGPGDLLGSRQAGLDLFAFFDFSLHGDLVELARQKAAEHLKSDPGLKASWVKPFIAKAELFLSC